MSEVTATENVWLYSKGVFYVAECSDCQALYCRTKRFGPVASRSGCLVNMINFISSQTALCACVYLSCFFVCLLGAAAP
jgi:hypothetical protein